MANRQVFAALILVGMLLALGVCSKHTGIEELDRPAVSTNTLPSEVHLTGQIDPHSIRFLTAHEQLQFYVASSSDAMDGCIIVVPSDATSRWAAGCGLLGSNDIVVTASNGATTASLVRDNGDTRAEESDGWSRIHDNVLIPSR